MEYKLKCADGTLFADEEKIMIRKKNFDGFQTAIMGNRAIFYSDISSIEFKKSGLIGGYMKFILAGTDERKRTGFGYGITKNFKDQNSLALIPGTNKKAIEIYNFILKKMEDARRNANVVINNSNNTNELNYLEELEKLADLKEKGILSEEEFNSKKQQILESNK